MGLKDCSKALSKLVTSSKLVFNFAPGSTHKSNVISTTDLRCDVHQDLTYPGYAIAKIQVNKGAKDPGAKEFLKKGNKGTHQTTHKNLAEIRFSQVDFNEAELKRQIADAWKASGGESSAGGYVTTGESSTGGYTGGYVTTGESSTGGYAGGYVTTGESSTGGYTGGNVATGGSSTGGYTVGNVATGGSSTSGYTGGNVATAEPAWEWDKKMGLSKYWDGQRWVFWDTGSSRKKYHDGANWQWYD